MRRLLTSLLTLPFAALAQTPQQDVVSQQVNEPVPHEVQIAEEGDSNPQSSAAANRKANQKKRGKAETAQVVILGKTKYDLQSNSSVGRRIKAYEDGRVSAVWTQGETGPNFVNRGTGYNHFDGNEWQQNPSEISRLENTRTGWPNIGTFGRGDDATEFTMTHIAGDANEGTGGYVFSENSGIGAQDFTSEVRNTTSGPTGPIWYRSAAVGDTLYALANYNLPSLGDTELTLSEAKSNNDITVKSNVITPTVFYRSTDGGETFEDSNMMLPGYGDSSRRFRGVADQYSIDAKDSTVAVVIGADSRRLTLWKSLDAGKTWNRTVIRKLGVSTNTFRNKEWGRTDTVQGQQGGQLVTGADTLNDGSVSVVLDQEGTAHVTWGNYITAQYFGLARPGNDPSEISRTFQLNDNVMQYWNDDDQEIVNAGRAPTIGTEGDVAYVTPEEGAAYNVSAGTRPMISYLSPDTLFIVYEGAVAGSAPGLATGNNDFRDVYVVHSVDGGSTWSQPLNITDNALNQRESAYPSVARKIVDSQLHLIWQQDRLPGSSVGQQGIQTSTLVNEILYTNIDVNSIFEDSVDIGDPTNPVGVNNPAQENQASLAVYPNPLQAGEAVKVSLSLDEPANVQYKVVNAVGQVQRAENLGQVSSGQVDWQLPTNERTSGVYFIQVIAGDTTLTKKLVQQ